MPVGCGQNAFKDTSTASGRANLREKGYLGHVEPSLAPPVERGVGRGDCKSTFVPQGGSVRDIQDAN